MFGRLLERNTTSAISITDWAKMFRPGAGVAYAGQRYPSFNVSSTVSAGASYYDRNAVVFSCATNRILLFSEARFQFQQMRGGRPGDLFGNVDLAVFEQPWLGATTGDLLVQAELDIAEHGNSYWVRDGQFLQRLEPCNVTVATIGAFDREITGYQVGEKLGGYIYRTSLSDPGKLYLPDEIAHYKPHPSRWNRFVGMSWLTPCFADIESDDALTRHKQVTLGNGAQIPYVVALKEPQPPEAFQFFVEEFRRLHDGPENAGKAVFFNGGADLHTVGQTFETLSMKATQGAGETRIAACAGVPPVIVGLSEGLASATYSNYGQARRRLVDGTMRPLWRMFASAMQVIIDPPAGARLWYDDRDIPFLREDVKDGAEIAQSEATTIKQYIDAGFDPDAVIQAVAARDPRRLVGQHSGLFSVQLQPAGKAEQLALPV